MKTNLNANNANTDYKYAATFLKKISFVNLPFLLPCEILKHSNIHSGFVKMTHFQSSVFQLISSQKQILLTSVVTRCLE